MLDCVLEPQLSKPCALAEMCKGKQTELCSCLTSAPNRKRLGEGSALSAQDPEDVTNYSGAQCEPAAGRATRCCQRPCDNVTKCTTLCCCHVAWSPTRCRCAGSASPPGEAPARQRLAPGTCSAVGALAPGGSLEESLTPGLVAGAWPFGLFLGRCEQLIEGLMSVQSEILRAGRTSIGF